MCADVAAAIVHSLSAHASVAAVCEAGCEVLANIANSDAGQAACVDVGAPRAVVAALTTHAGVAAVCKAGCGALTVISCSDAGAATCVAAGAPRVLAATLATHMDSPDVRLYAYWAFLFTSPGDSDAHLHTIEVASVVPELVQALVQSAVVPFARSKVFAALEELGYTNAGAPF